MIFFIIVALKSRDVLEPFDTVSYIAKKKSGADCCPGVRNVHFWFQSVAQKTSRAHASYYLTLCYFGMSHNQREGARETSSSHSHPLTNPPSPPPPKKAEQLN